MKQRKLSLAILFVLILSSVCFAQDIKQPVVAGTFYSDSSSRLSKDLQQFLKKPKPILQDKKIIALIVPHAGYKYSAGVAAYSYKAIEGEPIRTVILIGASHYEHFEGALVYPKGAWRTPLGDVFIDSELAQRLIDVDAKISADQSVFAREHSLEVQLPFLQTVLDDFKIVPILMGRLSYASSEALASAILMATENRDDVLVIASTDMSHYHSYSEANEIDAATIKELMRLNPKTLYYKLVTGESELCGGAAVVSALIYANHQVKSEIKVLNYANSGDVTADKNRVVGYLSALIYVHPVRNEISNRASLEGESKMNAHSQDQLNKEQKKRLLEIARQSVNAYVISGKTLDFEETDPFLLAHMGAFVTIHNNGKLRGCIGNIIGQQPLYLTVRDMAIASSTNDRRFSPVTVDELEQIDIEISVLTKPKIVSDVEKIKMGVHGVIVKRGLSSGVFLPQVADETGWSREEFLSNLCAHKAGLPADAWKDKTTQIQSFTAQVFREEE